jgi:hypothetical protein
MPTSKYHQGIFFGGFNFQFEPFVLERFEPTFPTRFY